jgi:hypothetical protein
MLVGVLINNFYLDFSLNKVFETSIGASIGTSVTLSLFIVMGMKK